MTWSYVTVSRPPATSYLPVCGRMPLNVLRKQYVPECLKRYSQPMTAKSHRNRNIDRKVVHDIKALYPVMNVVHKSMIQPKCTLSVLTKRDLLKTFLCCTLNKTLWPMVHNNH